MKKARGISSLEELSIKNEPAISAIYYALLQSGYDYYSIERDAKAVSMIQSFISADDGGRDFFAKARQSGCEVYPYWPRAAMMETATFFIDLPNARFADFDGYKSAICSAKNISDAERDESLLGLDIPVPGSTEACHTKRRLPALFGVGGYMDRGTERELQK